MYRSTASRRQRGFTLIEVMVSLMILVVGVLGVAALQATALKNLRSSGSLATAAMLASSLGDRMLANPVQAQADAYVHDAVAKASLEKMAPAKDCVTNTCDAAELAAYDIYDWQRELLGYTTESGVVVPSILGAASGEVDKLAGTSTYRITVRWDDDGSGSTGTNCPPQSEDDLDCYRTAVVF